MADERFWSQLLPLLEEERVIPVIGHDLLVIEVDGERLHLYEHLARRLSTRLGLPPPAPRTLDELACRHLAERWPLEDLYPALKLELEQLERAAPPASFCTLAEIRWFKLYVSTTFDNLLWQAVDKVRHGGDRLTHAAAFALNDRRQDLPAELSKLQRPVVYQLLGRASAIQETYAVTDEDLLEFVHKLQIPERRPPLLFDALAENHVLLIGGGMSPWLVRFFLRTVKHRERLWQVRGKAGFVVDTAAREDTGFINFLRYYSDRTFVYQSGSAEQFIDELGNRWKARNAAGSTADPSSSPAASEEIPRHSVFLSYASEDRALVERIKAQLDAAGIDAWFDRAVLQPGDTWKRKISLGIDAAAVFVPVISSSVLGPGGREYRVEWEEALEARKRRPRERDGSPARFILPVVVDDTNMNESLVGSYFRDMQGTYLRGGELTDEFRAHLVTLIQRAQLVA